MEGLSDAQRKAAGEPFQFIIGDCETRRAAETNLFSG